jgi:hypothetical protein
MQTTSPGTIATLRPQQGVLPHLIDFFDPNHDGKISMRETYDGLRRLDIGALSSLGFAAGINLGLAAMSRSSPFALDLAKMSRTRHPGDSAIVDDAGSFHDERLARIFDRYARTFADALTPRELLLLVRDDLRARGRILTLPRDLAAVAGEWGLLWWAGGEERDGRRVLTRQRLYEFYTDATLFDRIAVANDERRVARAQTALGRFLNIFHRWIF